MTSTQTPSSLAGAYEPASPGTRGWREAMARPLRLDGKRVTVVVEGPAGRTAYLFVGGIAGEPYELPADVTDVNAWAQQMVAEQVAQPDAAPAAAPRPVATVSVPGSFAEWLEGTNAMTGTTTTTRGRSRCAWPSRAAGGSSAAGRGAWSSRATRGP